MSFWNRNEWIVEKNDKPPKNKRSVGMNMDAELKLLRWMAKHSTGSLAREVIYDYGDNLANVEGLIKDGLLHEEKINDRGKERVYYRISPSGYRFVKENDERQRNLKINIAILIITILTLIISIISFL